MTRKQALHKTLDIITDEELKDKINEILDDIPFTGWSRRTIFDTVDQFIIDNGRVPTATDFKKKRLPPHTVIKLRFGVNLKEFLAQYYPTQKLCDSKIYFGQTREYWQAFFIKEYHKNKPVSAEAYNDARQGGSPSWATVAKMFKVTKWLDWLNFCDIIPYANKTKTLPITISSVMTVVYPDGHSFCVEKNGDTILIDGVPLSYQLQ